MIVRKTNRGYSKVHDEREMDHVLAIERVGKILNETYFKTRSTNQTPIEFK